MVQFIDKSLRSPFALQNVGAIDRTIRGVIGVGMMGAWFFYPIETVGLAFAALPLVGALVFFSGILGWDPFYALLGKKTCGVDEAHMCGAYPDQVSHLIQSDQPKKG